MRKPENGFEPLIDIDDNDFNAGESSSNPNEFESVELRSRNDRSRVRNNGIASSNPSDVILIDRKLKDGETLLKLSLIYSVSQADLKRVNNLVSDQDFYALKYIKIPVKKYSHAELTLRTESGTPELEDNGPYLPIDASPNYNRTRSDSPRSISSDDHRHKFEKILENADSTVEKAKQAAEIRETGIFTASDGDSHYVTNRSSSLSEYMERSICHYVMLVLCAFLIIVIPVCVFIYVELLEDDVPP